MSENSSKDAYYDQIAKGYNNLHKEEQEKKLAILKQHLKPNKEDKLLDVGCGTGISSNWDCDVIGIDSSKELLRQNSHKHIQADAEDLPFEGGSFDYIISLTAIQNFRDINKALQEIKRVAKRGAKIAISYLKKSPKADKIESEINNIFKVQKRIEEDKDIIFLLL